MTDGISRRHGALAWLLRMLGAVDLLAVAFVFLPAEVIAAAQRLTGMEGAPDAPLVGYLIRTSSALYALHGALILFLSCDVQRYRPLIRLLGWLAIAHGALSIYIGIRVGMPLWWRCIEGPIFAAAGMVILVLLGRNRSTSPIL